MKLFLLVAAISVVSAHMGISSPVSLDAVVGDAYRYPTSSDNAPTNGGACHGRAAGAKYTWVWTPRSSGTCEIYQNCWATEPRNLATSFGAAHDGGPCKLYECTGAVTMPSCVRMQLPDSFGTCRMIASSPDCTLKGGMLGRASGVAPAPQAAPAPAPAGGASTVRCGTDWTNANGKCGKSCTVDADCGAEKCFKDLTPCAAGSPTNPPAIAPPNLTPSKIRCGLDWGDANGKCGTQCTTNSQCTFPEKCFADLNRCTSAGTPVAPPTSTGNTGTRCVSLKPYITDAWCQGVQCADVYKDFCSSVAKSAAVQAVTVTCQLQAVAEGDTWDDVAFKYDVKVEALKAENPTVTGALAAGTVLEIPGDCTRAKKEGIVVGNTAARALPAAGLLGALCVFVF